MNGTHVVENTAAIFDTGTSQIIGDPDSIANLFGAIDGAQSASGGTYTSAFSSHLSADIFVYLQFLSPLHAGHSHLY